MVLRFTNSSYIFIAIWHLEIFPMRKKLIHFSSTNIYLALQKYGKIFFSNSYWTTHATKNQKYLYQRKCSKIVRSRFLEQFLIHVYTFITSVLSPTSPLEKYEQNLNDHRKVSEKVS